MLESKLDQDKSKWIVTKINKIRVWPHGFFGTLKRMRDKVRKLVKSSFFDNFMIFCVLVNTIILGIDRYNIP